MSERVVGRLNEALGRPAVRALARAGAAGAATRSLSGALLSRFAALL